MLEIKKLFFDYCGNKIYYNEMKNTAVKNPETIVFLHGWGSDSSVFYWIISSLVQRQNCILIDFMGFGKSDIPKTAVSVENQAEMVLSLCNYLEVKKFHIISHSYGGRVSFSLMSRENSRVLSALLVSPAGVKDKNLKKSAKVALFKLRKRLTKKRNIKKLEKYYSEDYKNATGVMRETFLLAIATDQTFQLDNIKCKVLIVRGNKDTAISKKVVKKISKRIKGSQLFEISGTHFAFLESPLQFKMLAENFFTRG